MSDTDSHPRPALAADVVAFRFRSDLEILLIERGRAPFLGAWALPGGFVDPGEAPEKAAARELAEETALQPDELRVLAALGTYGEPGRDPRGWVVSAAYVALVGPDAAIRAGDDATRAAWHRIDALPELAFDHARIIEDARQWLRRSTQCDTSPLVLLDSPFRTARARSLYARILGRPIPPRPFKAWLRRREAVVRVGPARYRPAERLTTDWIR